MKLKLTKPAMNSQTFVCNNHPTINHTGNPRKTQHLQLVSLKSYLQLVSLRVRLGLYPPLGVFLPPGVNQRVTQHKLELELVGKLESLKNRLLKRHNQNLVYREPEDPRILGRPNKVECRRMRLGVSEHNSSDLKLSNVYVKLYPQDTLGFKFKCKNEFEVFRAFTKTSQSKNFNTSVWSYANLSFFHKQGSTLTGFKKLLFNRVSAHKGVLVPAYNRRKYGRSHGLLIQNECAKLSKTFGYISLKTLNFWLAQTLACTYGEQVFNKSKQKHLKNETKPCKTPSSKFNETLNFLSSNKVGTKGSPLAKFTFALETQSEILLWKAQISRSFYQAKQFLTHQKGCASEVKPVVALWLKLKFVEKTGVFKPSVRNLIDVGLNQMTIKTKRWVQPGHAVRSV